MRSILLISALVYSMSGFAAEKSEWLVKFNNKQSIQTFSQQSSSFVKDLNFANWVKVSLTDQQAQQLKNHSNVVSLEKNQIFKIQTDFEIHDPATRKMIADRIVATALADSLVLRLKTIPIFHSKDQAVAEATLSLAISGVWLILVSKKLGPILVQKVIEKLLSL